MGTDAEPSSDTDGFVDVDEATGESDIESEDLEEADFNNDMLEEDIEDMDGMGESEAEMESGEDIVPEDVVEVPDAQEFENMMDQSAESLADEEPGLERNDGGDYEDQGDFDYLDEVDVDAEEMENMTDSDLSPDNMGEDIGEIAEEVGEVAEEGEAIIAALL